MRIASRLFASLALVLSLPSTQAAAQQPNNKPPTCDGKYNIVRVSEIKPGMMDKFFEAVSAQQAWYKKVEPPTRSPSRPPVPPARRRLRRLRRPIS